MFLNRHHYADPLQSSNAMLALRQAIKGMGPQEIQDFAKRLDLQEPVVMLSRYSMSGERSESGPLQGQLSYATTLSLLMRSGDPDLRLGALSSDRMRDRTVYIQHKDLENSHESLLHQALSEAFGQADLASLQRVKALRDAQSAPHRENFRMHATDFSSTPLARLSRNTREADPAQVALCAKWALDFQMEQYGELYEVIGQTEPGKGKGKKSKKEAWEHYQARTAQTMLTMACKDGNSNLARACMGLGAMGKTADMAAAADQGCLELFFEMVAAARAAPAAFLAAPDALRVEDYYASRQIKTEPSSLNEALAELALRDGEAIQKGEQKDNWEWKSFKKIEPQLHAFLLRLFKEPIALPGESEEQSERGLARLAAALMPLTPKLTQGSALATAISKAVPCPRAEELCELVKRGPERLIRARLEAAQASRKWRAADTRELWLGLAEVHRSLGLNRSRPEEKATKIENQFITRVIALISLAPKLLPKEKTLHSALSDVCGPLSATQEEFVSQAYAAQERAGIISVLPKTTQPSLPAPRL